MLKSAMDNESRFLKEMRRRTPFPTRLNVRHSKGLGADAQADQSLPCPLVIHRAPMKIPKKHASGFQARCTCNLVRNVLFRLEYFVTLRQVETQINSSMSIRPQGS